MEGPICIENLVGPATPLTYHRALLKQQCLMKLLFYVSWLVTKGPCSHTLTEFVASLSDTVSV